MTLLLGIRALPREAHLQGTLGTIPLNIWLNKYAGPAGGQRECE